MWAAIIDPARHALDWSSEKGPPTSAVPGRQSILIRYIAASVTWIGTAIATRPLCSLYITVPSFGSAVKNTSSPSGPL